MDANANKTKSEPEVKTEVLMRCVVLESRLVIGAAMYGKGAMVLLPKAEADALAGMTPPKLKVIGV
jgi:GH18 family chitinase